MIWLVGANGMLGKEVLLLLQKKNISFVYSDQEIDISDFASVLTFANNNNISQIINCAAYTQVDKAEEEKEKAFLVNAIGVRNLAKIAKKKNARLIHISTDYVFDGYSQDAYLETDVTNPLSVYGESKLQGEYEVQNNCNRYIILRTSWLYGAHGKNFVKTMMKLMNSRETLSIVNDQFGSPTSAYDLAHVIFNIITSSEEHRGIYHYSNRGCITWYQFALEILALGKKYQVVKNNCELIPITTQQYPTPARRPIFSYLSKEKIQKHLGIVLLDWKASLDRFIKYKTL